MRLFALIDSSVDRNDRPFLFISPFTIEWVESSTPTVETLTGATLPPTYSRSPRLGILVRESPTGNAIADFTEAQDVMFATGPHGFAEMTGRMMMNLYSAFSFYHRQDPMHMLVTDGRETIYEGRVEDVGISHEGLQFQAFGYYRATTDLLVSAIYSDEFQRDWFFLDSDEYTGAVKEKFFQDKANRLHMAPNQDETFSSTSAISVIGYRAPHNSITDIVELRFSYRFDMASPWKVELHRCDRDWTSLSVEWSLTGNGSLQTETNRVETFSGCEGLMFVLYYNGSATTYTGETGDEYLTISNPRVRGLTDSPLSATAVVKGLLDHIVTANPTQLSAEISEIKETGIAIDQAVYEDARPADIMTELAAIGDDQTPPQQFAVQVWEDRRLTFAPVNRETRHWYVDVVDIQVERSFSNMYNSIYAVYNLRDRGNLRTDAATTGGYGVTRMGFVDVKSVSSSLAEQFRDAAIEDQGRERPRASIKTTGLYDNLGVEHPLYLVRAGDTITLRNLPPDLGELDNLRTFRVGYTRYYAATDTLEPEPEDPIPSIAVVIARQEKGVVL